MNSSKSHSVMIARIALMVALIAVSAWISIPIGAVPITLQIFAISLALCVLSPKEALIAIFAYLVLGAIGVPVFSGMRGGFGVLAGATGGFLWGYAVAMLLIFVLMKAMKKEDDKSILMCALKCAIMLAVCYVCGTFHFCLMLDATIAKALAVCVAPFVVLDLIKIILAIMCGKAVNSALAALAHK